MIEIFYLREISNILSLPQEVKGVIKNVLTILDAEYGDDRDKYKDDGGNVVIS